MQLYNLNHYKWYTLYRVYHYNYINNEIVRIETKVFGSTGTGGWSEYSFNFSKAFTIEPLISIIPASNFATENICLISYDVNGVKFRVYGPSTTFTYTVRVFAIGY